MSSKHRSTKKRNLENGCRLLRTSLEYFISLTPGFHKNSYGEIQFKGTGSRPTYAPFVTCDATTSPENVMRLLTEQWTISFPKIAILVNGEFYKRDYSWLNVMNDSWLITNGSSPSHQRSYNSCTIAIMDINSIENKDALTSQSNKGMFPAVYQQNKGNSGLKSLDQTHTHFIFVADKQNLNVNDFRRKFLAYISSIPLEFDTNSTSFVTLPVVTVLVSDDLESLSLFASDIEAGYPYAFCATASFTVDLIRDAHANNFEVTGAHLKKVRRKSEAVVLLAQDKTGVASILNLCAGTNGKLRVYPSADYALIRLALLEAIKTSKNHSVRSTIRLAMIWDCMDELKCLVYSKKQFEGEEDYMSVYLFVALSLDRSEFLIYLLDLGVNPYAKLTVKMLWLLYYECLYNDQYVTETSFVIRRYVKEFVTRDASNLLSVIGRFISRVTKYEVNGLYSSSDYKDDSCKVEPTSTRQLAWTFTFEDDSPVVPHADRDLFLWCILFGKTDLAKLFWKNGSNYAASALIARGILRGQAELIDFNTQDSALADELHEESDSWAQKAIVFVEASFRLRKQATLSLLTHKIAEFGGCSALHLGYVTKCPEFIGQPAPQSALDYIWLGKTKKGKPKWKTFATLICPFLVPCLNVVDRTNHFLPSVSQVYQSTFTNQEDNDQNEDREAGLGAGVVYVMQTISRTVPEGNFSAPKKQLSRAANFSEDIFDYFNSPSIKFLVHSMFLVASMVILSLILVLRAPPYFSLDKTNLLTFLVLFYMIGITVDEIRQIATTHDNISGMRKITNWLSDTWNRIDFLMVLSFFIGKGLTFATTPQVYVIKLCFALTLFFMAMRCFQIYLVFPVLGPKIYMMGKMFRDVRVFLSIMALVFFCYGVIIESIKSEIRNPQYVYYNPNSTENFVIFLYNAILREPYWQIYGNALGSATDPKYDIDNFVPVIITSFYVLFANLLMVNLLIAMFSYTFQNIQDNAFLYWKFHRFEVVKEFWNRPWLPSPFILIEDGVRFLQWFHNMDSRRNQAFNRSITVEQKELLGDFEKEVQTLLTERERLEEEAQSSLQKDVKKILEKMEEYEMLRSEEK